MELRYVILARHVEYSDRSTLSLIGGDADKLVAEEYPASVPALNAAVRLVIERDELSRTHQIQCRIVPAGSDDVIAEGSIVQIPRFEIPNDGDRETEISIGLPAQIANVLLPERGKYEFQVVVDGKAVGSAPFRIEPLAFYKKWIPVPIDQEPENASRGPDHDQP